MMFRADACNGRSKDPKSSTFARFAATANLQSAEAIMKRTDMSEFESLLPSGPFTRRDFIGATLASGFALAVRPVSAETIVTDDDGLIATPVSIPVADGEIPAYRAIPDGAGPFPVVLVVQEIFGVHEHIRDLCRRLAKQGYFAVAPALFHRQGDPAGVSDIPTILTTIVSRVPDTQVISDLDATVAWAAAQAQADAARLAITGFCWGGRIVWLYAAHNPALKAGVAWYGRLQGDRTALQPAHPVDMAGELKAPVLGLYGGADQGIPPSSIEAMRDALKDTSVKSEIVVYPDTPHGFNADYRPSYRPDAARNGWERMLAWFQQHGVAPR
jgi:carboxymethylenebutenolidase